MALINPIGHGRQLEAAFAPGNGLDVFFGQDEQLPAPTPLYFPTGQEMQLAAPTTLYVPA